MLKDRGKVLRRLKRPPSEISIGMLFGPCCNPSYVPLNLDSTRVVILDTVLGWWSLLFVPTSSNIQISIQPLLRQMNAEVGGGITTGQSAASVDDVFSCTFQIPIDFTIKNPYSLILYRQYRFWLVTCGFPEDVVGPRAPVNENQVILLWVACSWPFVELIYHRPAGSACRTANKAAKL